MFPIYRQKKAERQHVQVNSTNENIDTDLTKVNLASFIQFISCAINITTPHNISTFTGLFNFYRRMKAHLTHRAILQCILTEIQITW